MKKAIKAIVGIALALSFAVVPSAINSGDASSSSSITTVSANSGFVVVPNHDWQGGAYKYKYKVYYQGRFYCYTNNPNIG